MQYDKTFKEEAVRLSDEIGPKKAAEQLGIPYHTLSYWRRTKSRYGQQAFPGSGKARIPKEAAEQRIRELEKEKQNAPPEPEGALHFGCTLCYEFVSIILCTRRYSIMAYLRKAGLKNLGDAVVVGNAVYVLHGHGHQERFLQLQGLFRVDLHLVAGADGPGPGVFHPVVQVFFIVHIAQFLILGNACDAGIDGIDKGFRHDVAGFGRRVCQTVFPGDVHFHRVLVWRKYHGVFFFRDLVGYVHVTVFIAADHVAVGGDFSLVAAVGGLEGGVPYRAQIGKASCRGKG